MFQRFAAERSKAWAQDQACIWDRSAVPACLLPGQLHRAAAEHLYSLKGICSCCPLLRIPEQTWWPHWATLVPLGPLPSGNSNQEQLQWSPRKHCSMAEWRVQSRADGWLAMETWEGSIPEAWSKSKRNCSLHFRQHMALSLCLGALHRQGEELRTRTTP